MLSPCALESELKERKSFQKFHTNPKVLSYSKTGRLSKYCNTRVNTSGKYCSVEEIYCFLNF